MEEETNDSDPEVKGEDTTTLQDLPDSLILQILNYLNHTDIALNVAQTNWRLNRVCTDEILWRNMFHRHFRMDGGLLLEPSYYSSWRREFRRLVDETPIVEVEVIHKHTDQVLHVSFSHDGKRFATSAKDGLIVVWRNGHPVKQEYFKNMKFFSWKYTQFSQFNESDTLLLVSGVLFGQNSTSGEICIFSLKDGFLLQCRVMSKPYDIFGTWYSDMFFLSGQHQWLDNNMVSKSVIWLNKASQESQSEHAAIMNELYRFYNPKASSVRSLLIANCVDGEEPMSTSSRSDKIIESDKKMNSDEPSTSTTRTGNPLSSLQLEQAEDGEQDLLNINSRGHQGNLKGAFQNWRPLDNIANINYTNAYRNNDRAHCSKTNTGVSEMGGISCGRNRKGAGDDDSTSSLDDLLSVDDLMEGEEMSEASSSPDEDKNRTNASGEEVLDCRDKWLIFTCSSETYTPHRIGFKRITPVHFNGRIDPGPSVKERIEEYKRLRQLEIDGVPEADQDWANYAKVADKFDKADHQLDLHGHIIGMALSPDHRYLYVNSRPWPEGYKISNPLDPPPIASEIDIHVIDLKTITQVGMMRRAHRAYTPNEECFFIFLDTCDQFVASGAEDKHGYVWDRHYGISLVKLPHTDVVNSVAFNPMNSQMLVTVSDDNNIKVWRSKYQCRRLNLDIEKLEKGTTLYNLRRRRGPTNSS